MMVKEIRFPQCERRSRGRHGYFQGAGLHLRRGHGVVELLQLTSKGEVSEAARLVIPMSHVAALRDALYEMIEGDSQKPAFWVYAAPNGARTVHRPDCVHCCNGSGQLRYKDPASAADWHPFRTRKEAFAFVAPLEQGFRDGCGHCKPWEEPWEAR